MLVAAIAAVAAIVHAPGALAQAWLPDKGSFSVAMDYSTTYNKYHYNFRGDSLDFGHTRTNVLSVGVSYSPTDRLLLRAGLPLVETRYVGAFPHPGFIDNGQWHRKVTDFQATLHYQLVDGPFALAPYVGYNTPTQDYVTLGHASPGRGLQEVSVGFFAAQTLNEWIPGAYVQTRYNYAFVQEVANVSHDRSNADLELGYFFNRDWSVRALGSWQWTHGGLPVPTPPSHPLFEFHDQLAEDEYFNVGGGVAWRINDRYNLHLLYVQGLSGKNSHKVESRYSLGLSYSPGGGH